MPRQTVSAKKLPQAGASGNFKTGDIVDVKAAGLDVCKAILDALGAKDRLGAQHRKSISRDLIRA